MKSTYQFDGCQITDARFTNADNALDVALDSQLVDCSCGCGCSVVDVTVTVKMNGNVLDTDFLDRNFYDRTALKAYLFNLPSVKSNFLLQ